MNVQETIEILKQHSREKEVVIDNCDGTISPLLQIAELKTSDSPTRHYIAMVFDEN